MAYRVVLDADGVRALRACAGRTAVTTHSVLYLDLPRLFLTRLALRNEAHAVVIRARAKFVDGTPPAVSIELRRRSGDMAVHQRWSATPRIVCALAGGADESEALDLRRRLELAVFAGVPVMHELRPVVVIRYARLEWCVGRDGYLALEEGIAYHRPPPRLQDALDPQWESGPAAEERGAVLDVDVCGDAPVWLRPILSRCPPTPFSKLRNAVRALHPQIVKLLPEAS